MWGRIISTHALTEGDLEFFGLLKGDDISTHALTEGDHQPAATGSPVSYFNSRPHGGRLHWLFFLRTKRYFNSRPHGGRRHCAESCNLEPISTHALTEGDLYFFGSSESVCVFQLTPSRRATVTYGDMSVSVPVFQLTPSRRATDGRNYESRSRKFQLTPSRRATKISAYSPDSLIFQLTPSRRATMKS